MLNTIAIYELRAFMYLTPNYATNVTKVKEQISA